MENKKNTTRPFILGLQASLMIIGMFFLVALTIYIQQPNPVEINQITFAGKETIRNNNKYAFDLFKWAPGYTDQALIQIDNNTGDSLDWNISLKNLETVDESLMKSIGVYIKENPTSRDILPMYDSVITDGYKYFGTLSELKDLDFIYSTLEKNKSINLSILFHVAEDSNIKETDFEFRNVLKVSINSKNNEFEKIFE